MYFCELGNSPLSIPNFNSFLAAAELGFRYLSIRLLLDRHLSGKKKVSTFTPRNIVEPPTRLTRKFYTLEAFTGKAFKCAAVLRYRKALIPPPMGGSVWPEG